MSSRFYSQPFSPVFTLPDSARTYISHPKQARHNIAPQATSIAPNSRHSGRNGVIGGETCACPSRLSTSATAPLSLCRLPPSPTHSCATSQIGVSHPQKPLWPRHRGLCGSGLVRPPTSLTVLLPTTSQARSVNAKSCVQEKRTSDPRRMLLQSGGRTTETGKGGRQRTAAAGSNSGGSSSSSSSSSRNKHAGDSG